MFLRLFGSSLFGKQRFTRLLLNRHFPYGPVRDHHGRLSTSIEAQADVFKIDFAVATPL